MNRRLAAALVLQLSCASTAWADLGNCWVVGACDPRLGGACEEVASKYILRAYEQSDISDFDLFFILRLDDQLKPGAYSLTQIKLVRGPEENWTLWGYEIAAGDVTGILNGAVEIGQAFAAGNDTFGNLAEGPRDGLVTEPRLKEAAD